MVVNMIQNWNKRYYSDNSNIKYENSIIKCIDFESFYYAINLNNVLFFVVFNKFDFIFLLMYC